MISEIIHFTPADGWARKGHLWAPKSRPVRAAVALLHGFGEHTGRYVHVGKAFAEQGFALAGVDHAGHGHSAGKRGHIPSFEGLMEETEAVFNLLSERFPDQPQFIYGHSWGGTLALNYLIRRKPQVKGALITSPWLELAEKPPGIKVALGKLMYRIYPSWTEKAPIKPEALSRDPEVGEAADKDPQNHRVITTRAFFDTLDAAQYALQNAGSIQPPMLLLHGEADPLISPLGSKKLHKALRNEVEFHLMPDARHELHNELNKEEIIRQMLDWIEAHSASDSH